MFYDESKQTLVDKKHLYKKAAAGNFKYHIPTNAEKHKIATNTKNTTYFISFTKVAFDLVSQPHNDKIKYL